MLSLHFPRTRGVPGCDAAVVGVHCTRLGALRPEEEVAGAGVAPSVNLVQDTDKLYVDSVPTRDVEVQYGREGELFGWHALDRSGGHHIPTPGPGTWTLQVRLMAWRGAGRVAVGPVCTYTLQVTGE
jgi:hypothetical protein